MRISPQSPPADSTPGVVDEEQVLQRLEQMQMQVLGRRALASLILEPRLDLYQEERKRMTIDEVAEKMRMHDIKIRLYEASAGGKTGAEAFEIRFDYPDRYKAQQVVRELTGKFMEMDFAQARKTGSAGNRLELLEPADLPGTPAMPNHIAFLWAGLGAGLLLGLLSTLVWRQPKWTLQMAGFIGAGLALALAVAYFIPDVYGSRAVLRIASAADSARMADRVQQIDQQVLGHDNLARLIQLPDLDLYKKQRAQMPISDVVEKMRMNIRISLYQARPAGHSQAFMISFRYPDRYKAQQTVRALSGQFMEWNLGRPGQEAFTLEMLESADLPQTPMSPNRRSIAVLGAFAGLLIGLVTLRWRRGRRPQLTPAPAAA